MQARKRNGRNGNQTPTPPSTPTHQKSHKHNGLSQSVAYSRDWDEHLPLPRLTFTKAALIVFCIALLCFINSHDGAFVFDDSEAILNNQDLKPESPLLDLFWHDFWGSKLASNSSHKSYRPLTVLTFRLNYLLGGGLHPWNYHVCNILLHACISVLFLLTFSVLFSGQLLDEEGRLVFKASRASLLCALIFAVHPIHTECVAGVVGRADLMCALTFLLAFLSYVKSCQTGNAVQTRPSSFSVSWFCLSMLLCGLSVLFKEQGITVLGICSAYDILVQCRIDLLSIVGLRGDHLAIKTLPPRSPSRSPSKFNRLLQNGNNNNNKKVEDGSWVKSLVYRHIFLAVTGMFILAGRWRIMGSAPPTFQVVDNPHSFHNSTLFRLLNYNYLYSLNVWLLLNPWWLCFDWSMGCVPVISMVTDPRILAAIMFWFGMSSLGYHCLNTQPSRQTRLLSMSMALMVVPFLPATNMFFRVGFVIAERILYLPSAGFCMLVVLGATHICKQKKYRKMVLVAMTILLVTFTVRSIQRSYQWKTEKKLFEIGSLVCPGNAKVHYNIAKIHADMGNTESAISKYKHAIDLNPDYDQAMNNLGNMMKEKGQLNEAEKLLDRATRVRPEFAAAWMNLGIVQAALKKTSQAEASYRTALKHRKKYPDCYYNLGNLYLDMGRHQEALTAWREATVQKPTHSSAWSNMIILLDNLGLVDDLKAAAEESLKHLSQDAALFYNVANAFGKASRYADSEKYFLQAIELDPENHNYHSNLGVLYHRWGRYRQAEQAYLQALMLDPSAAQTQDNLDMLHRKMAEWDPTEGKPGATAWENGVRIK